MKAKRLTLSYKVPSGAIYKIRYRRPFGTTNYTMHVLEHPPCRYPLGVVAHLLEANTICILQGYEPHTIERAKALALHWITGFEEYRRSGNFPNGKSRIDVKEVTA